MKIECVKFKPLNKGYLLGFATLRFPDWNIEIRDCSFFRKTSTNAEWIGWPSRTYEENNEKKYFPYFTFIDPAKAKSFVSDCIYAIKKHPDFCVDGFSHVKSEDKNVPEELPF